MFSLRSCQEIALDVVMFSVSQMGCGRLETLAESLATFWFFYMLKISTEKDICGCSNFPSEHLHECTSTLIIKMHENS